EWNQSRERTGSRRRPSSRCVQFASSAKTGTSEVDAATRERAGKRGGRPLQRMRETVQSEHESVCVVGLGTVGAPTAEYFLGRGIPTYGCDLDPIALGRRSPRLHGKATTPAALPTADVDFVTFSALGRPSKSPSQTSDSTRTSGVVS